MTHAFYVYAAWTMSAIVLLVLMLWTLLDGRALKAELKRLEAQGIRRRSASGDKQ